ATFNTLIEQSNNVPIIVDLYSGRSQASAELSNTLQQLVTEYAGKFLLARVNADTESDIVAAFGVQALPTTVAIVKTQPLPLFQGVHEAAQIRQVLDEVLRVAAENGVTGTLDVSQDDAEEPDEEPLPPHLQEAYDAIEQQDFDAAIAARKQGLQNNPADADAKPGLAQAQLPKRLEGPAPERARADAREARVGEVDTQLLAPDVEVGSGELSAGFQRGLAVSPATAAEEREIARKR